MAAFIKEFDIDIYFKIIEKMIVLEGNKIIVILLDGMEIECGIEYEYLRLVFDYRDGFLWYFMISCMVEILAS